VTLATAKSPSAPLAEGRGLRAFGLAWLFKPRSAREFVEEYWEKQSLFVNRADSRYFDALPGLDAVDELITATSSHSSTPAADVRIIKTQADDVLAERKPQALPNGLPDIHALYREYQGGCSLAVNHVHRRSASVAALCGALEADIHHPVGANLYLTPRDAQGFRPHADTHDVFILQLHGSKQWYVAAPSEELPLASTKTDAQASADEFQEHVLRQGDVLYLPRGFEHYARTRGDSSLHLTVRVEVFRWFDLMTEALHELAKARSEFRRALPPGFLRDPVDASEVRVLTELLTSQMQDPAFVELARARLTTRLVTGSKAATAGHFCSLDLTSEVTLESTVGRANGQFCRVLHTGESATVEFPGNFVSGPAFIAPALEFIVQHHEFVVQELPGDLSATDKVDLTVRMVIEGLLEIVRT